MQHTFRWKCSYLSLVWYDVTDETGTYEIEWRHNATEYEHSICNGEDIWQSEVLPAIGTIKRSHDVDTSIPESTVKAFNVWRSTEHDKFIAMMEAQPEKYGLKPDDSLRNPPQIVSGAVYVPGKGIQPS